MKNSRNNAIILIISLILLIGVAALFFFLVKTPSKEAEDTNLSENTAVRIIDGDTFELASGNIVRLICIDTPEKGEKRYEEAKEFLSSLILYKELRLEKDIDDKDEYGRLLRYVYVNDSGKEIFVNKEIVKEGYATVFAYGNDTKRCGEIKEYGQFP